MTKEEEDTVKLLNAQHENFRDDSNPYVKFIYSEDDPNLLIAQIEDATGATYQQIIRLYIEDHPPLVGKPSKIESSVLDFQSLKEEVVYQMLFNYDEQGELISTVDSFGETMIKIETSIDESPKENGYYFDVFEDRIMTWDTLVNSFFSCLQYLQFSTHQKKMRWFENLQLPAPFAHVLEKIGKTLFSGPTFLLMGLHLEETHVDFYGQEDINDKVRVTFINGILNTYEMLTESLSDISESHGGVKVHYVFRPTEGWTWDISRAIAIRTGFSFGFRSFHAHLVANLWKDLIQEMGGVEGGGVIIHYAHSLGGSDTDRARELLTPDEQKMIRVITFGSSTMVRNEGFQSVVNIISINDGVSSFIIEPLGHIRNAFDPDTNIRFHGFLHKPPYFPTDHMLNGPTYRTLLFELGDEFLKEFGPKDEVAKVEKKTDF